MTPVHWGTVEILEIPPYSDEEARAVWFDEDELASISADAFQTVKDLVPDDSWKSTQEGEKRAEEDERCIRGLEEMTVKGSYARIIAKLRMDSAVLEEQKRQRQRGIWNENYVAKASQLQSRQHVRRALALAKEDQDKADEILERRRREESSASNETNADQSDGPWFRRRRSATTSPDHKKSPTRRVGRAMKRMFGLTKE